jgi:hypothetical protein
LAIFIKMARTKISKESLMKQNKSQKRSRLEETFSPIVVENPIENISKLIEDLKQITSHLANDAYPILDDVYYIWFDHTLNMINIQTRLKYDHDEDVSGVISDDEKVGIQLNQKNEVIYYYEEVASERGIPFFLARHFEEIIKYVDEQVQIQNIISNFNPKFFRIFLIHFKGQRENNLYINNLQYNAWVTIAPYTNMNMARDVHNYFHIQIREVGEDIHHKLSLGVNEKHKIETVMLDDELILAPEKVQALLFSPTSIWKLILKSFMKDWISIYGIRVDGLQLQVHPITLEICPELVLNMYCGNDISHICFLNDNMTAQIPGGFDIRTETQMFITSLMKNLFDGGESRSIGISKYGYPYIHLGSDAKEMDGKRAARNLGKFFSIIVESNTPAYTTGHVLPDGFFFILTTILLIERKYPDKNLIKILSEQILGPSFSALTSYSNNDSSSSVKECLSTFQIANVDLSDTERKGGAALERKIFLYLRENIDQYMAFASELTKSMTPYTKNWIKCAELTSVPIVIQGIDS